MDLAQALVVVLSFPAVSFLLLLLTLVEKRMPGAPGPGPHRLGYPHDTAAPHQARS